MMSNKICPKTLQICQCSGCFAHHCMLQLSDINHREITIPMGWSCPKCQSVYSPQTTECVRCNRNYISVSHNMLNQTPAIVGIYPTPNVEHKWEDASIHEGHYPDGKRCSVCKLFEVGSTPLSCPGADYKKHVWIPTCSQTDSSRFIDCCVICNREKSDSISPVCPI